MKMKKAIAVVGLAGILLVGCGTGESGAGEASNDVQEKEPELELESRTEEKIDIDIEVTESEYGSNEYQDLFSKQDLEEMMLEVFKNNFDKVEFDEERGIYKIFPHTQVAYEVAEIKAGVRGQDSWDDLIETMLSTSEGLRKSIESGYSIALMNPVNEDNVLLLVSDGMVLYDEVNEDGLFQTVEWEKVDELVTNE